MIADHATPTPTTFDRIRDPVARTRAMLQAEIMNLKVWISESTDPDELTEFEIDLERATGQLESLDMCFH